MAPNLVNVLDEEEFTISTQLLLFLSIKPGEYEGCHSDILYSALDVI